MDNIKIEIIKNYSQYIVRVIANRLNQEGDFLIYEEIEKGKIFPPVQWIEKFKYNSALIGRYKKDLWSETSNLEGYFFLNIHGNPLNYARPIKELKEKEDEFIRRSIKNNWTVNEDDISQFYINRNGNSGNGADYILKKEYCDWVYHTYTEMYNKKEVLYTGILEIKYDDSYSGPFDEVYIPEEVKKYIKIIKPSYRFPIHSKEHKVQWIKELSYKGPYVPYKKVENEYGQEVEVETDSLILDKVNKKLQKEIKEIWKDNNGYWCILNNGEVIKACKTINEFEKEIKEIISEGKSK